MAPERGRFIPQPDLPIALNLTSPFVHIELASNGRAYLPAEGVTGVNYPAFLDQECLLDGVGLNQEISLSLVLGLDNASITGYTT